MIGPPPCFNVGPDGGLVQAALGNLVRFSDVEDALEDAVRLKWILPLIDGSATTEVVAFREVALGMAKINGKRGTEMIDQAMRVAP